MPRKYRVLGSIDGSPKKPLLTTEVESVRNGDDFVVEWNEVLLLYEALSQLISSLILCSTSNQEFSKLSVKVLEHRSLGSLSVGKASVVGSVEDTLDMWLKKCALGGLPWSLVIPYTV